MLAKPPGAEPAEPAAISGRTGSVPAPASPPLLLQSSKPPAVEWAEKSRLPLALKRLAGADSALPSMLIKLTVASPGAAEAPVAISRERRRPESRLRPQI